MSIEQIKLKLPEINNRELFTLVPLAVIVIFLGIWPHPVLSLMNSSLVHLIDLVKESSTMVARVF